MDQIDICVICRKEHFTSRCHSLLELKVVYKEMEEQRHLCFMA